MTSINTRTPSSSDSRYQNSTDARYPYGSAVSNDPRRRDYPSERTDHANGSIDTIAQRGAPLAGISPVAGGDPHPAFLSNPNDYHPTHPNASADSVPSRQTVRPLGR